VNHGLNHAEREMASITKRAGAWRALVRLKGHPVVSATFPLKREAEEWAAAEESAIRAGRRGAFPDKTLGDALTKYELEVTAHKRSSRAEANRLEAFRTGFPQLATKVMHKVTAADMSAWRDARLRKVTPGSVQRDINLLRHVWNVAANEWGWCAKETPWASIRLPGDNPPREPVWRWRQIRCLLRRMGYRTGCPPKTPAEDIAWMFRLALASAMRQGELHGLTKDRIDMGRRVIRLEEHKTAERVGVRHVPLPRRAARIVAVLAENADGDGRLFRVARGSVDTLFRRYRDQCLIEGLTFHDSRATALTLLARRTDVMTVARVSGHSDLKMLLERYYRERPEDIAARI
jgi:integrase